MKNLKKIVGLLLAAVMALSLSVTSFASGEGSITIKNAVTGETYKVYKMLDLVADSSYNSYLYTIASGWESFFDDDDVKNCVTFYTDSTGTYVTEITDVTTFEKLALAYAETITPTDSGTAAGNDTVTTLTIDGLDLGYYLVKSSVGAIVTLTTTDPAASIEEKNEVPDVEKVVQEDSDSSWSDENNADVGQVVYYRSTITDAANAVDLVLHDTMTTGLTFNDDVVVTVGGNTVTSGYTVTVDPSDGCTFDIKFNDDFTADLDKDAEIVITYSATVNSNAVVSGSETNTTWVKYGDSPSAAKKTTTTYVYEFYIYKYTTVTDGNGQTTEVPLENAEFILKNETTGLYYGGVGTDGKINWTDDDTQAVTFTTGSDGLVKIEGLDADSYSLEETTAPTGYNLLKDPVEFEIDDDGNVVQNSTAQILSVNGEPGVKVLNSAGTELPETGGIGTKIFYAVGGILVLGAAILLITRRRMRRG